MSHFYAQVLLHIQERFGKSWEHIEPKSDFQLQICCKRWKWSSLLADAMKFFPRHLSKGRRASSTRRSSTTPIRAFTAKSREQKRLWWKLSPLQKKKLPFLLFVSQFSRGQEPTVLKATSCLFMCVPLLPSLPVFKFSARLKILKIEPFKGTWVSGLTSFFSH